MQERKSFSAFRSIWPSMDAEKALELLRKELKRTSQARIAERMGVSDATISRWLSGKASPEGKRLEALIDWATRVQQEQGPPPDAITAAILATGENVQRLAEIRGYAQFVLDQLLDTAKRQQLVVDALAPWSQAEGRQIALDQERKAQALEAATRRAAAEAAAAGSPDARPAKKRASEG